MQTLRVILIVVFLQMCSCANAQNPRFPYVAYNASKGVILKSSVYHEEFYPVRGTKLFEKDTFLLKDEHDFVKIKNTKNGEISTSKGKGKRTPRQIANDYKYDSYDKLLSFFETIKKEIGFPTTPVHTSQGITPKGGTEEKNDSLSLIVASMVNKAISDSIYKSGVDVRKVYSQDNETFYYSVRNNDSVNYAMAIYTVDKNRVIGHNEVLVYKYGRVRPDKIEYIPLIRNFTINLDYFSLAMGEEDMITCYVLIFNPDDFYIKNEKRFEEDEDTYDFLLKWELVTKELTYQGDVNRVIYIKK